MVRNTIGLSLQSRVGVGPADTLARACDDTIRRFRALLRHDNLQIGRQLSLASATTRRKFQVVSDHAIAKEKGRWIAPPALFICLSEPAGRRTAAAAADGGRGGAAVPDRRGRNG